MCCNEGEKFYNSLSLSLENLPENALVIFMTEGLFVREEFLLEVTVFDQSLPLFTELVELRVQPTLQRESVSVRGSRHPFVAIFVEPAFDPLLPNGHFLRRRDAMLVDSRVYRHE